MNLLDEEFRAWETLMQRQSLSAKRHEDGLVEFLPQPTPAEQLKADALQERWVQRYLKEEFTCLGFTNVKGPFNRGPDYRVLHKRRWIWAEVETHWKNYLRHHHHVHPAFDNVKYLIVLSAATPSPDALDRLPPRILHINRQHFLAWYEKAAAPELLGKEFSARVAILAGAMQQHWTTICSDTERGMAICPFCDNCAYFGDGGFGEATPFYQGMAARFLQSTGLTDTGRADLSKVKTASLERFVEEHLPGE